MLRAERNIATFPKEEPWRRPASWTHGRAVASARRTQAVDVRHRDSLSAAGYLFVVLVGLICLAALAVRQVWLPAQTLDQAVSSKIVRPPGHTVVLALRTSCPYCAESMPFYKSLADTYRNSDTVSITAVFPDAAGAAAAYLRIHQLDLRAVPEQPLTTLGVDATPTLLIVDHTGRILKGWVGVLTKEQEAEVMALIAELGT